MVVSETDKRPSRTAAPVNATLRFPRCRSAQKAVTTGKSGIGVLGSVIICGFSVWVKSRSYGRQLHGCNQAQIESTFSRRSNGQPKKTNCTCPGLGK